MLHQWFSNLQDIQISSVLTMQIPVLDSQTSRIFHPLGLRWTWESALLTSDADTVDLGTHLENLCSRSLPSYWSLLPLPTLTGIQPSTPAALASELSLSPHSVFFSSVSSLDSKEHHFGLSSPLICDAFVQAFLKEASIKIFRFAPIDRLQRRNPRAPTNPSPNSNENWAQKAH